jgi:hypothetical protein
MAMRIDAVISSRLRFMVITLRISGIGCANLSRALPSWSFVEQTTGFPSGLSPSAGLTGGKCWRAGLKNLLRATGRYSQR